MSVPRRPASAGTLKLIIRMAPAKQQRKRAANGEEASAASEERGEAKPKRMGRPPKNADRWDDDLGEFILKDGSVYK